MRKFILLFIAFFGMGISSAATISQKPDIRLYTLDCGNITMRDGYDFSDIGYYQHKTLYFSDPCFLIKHPKGWMLWDTGIGDKYYQHPLNDNSHGYILNEPKTFISQLHELGLEPNDIRYLGLSHTHWDHTGNANLFQGPTTWLLQRSEYTDLQNKYPLSKEQNDSFASVIQSDRVHKLLLNGDYDVYGDGTLVILYTPGHTIGHQSLKITLPKSGVIILPGDLYHTRQAFQHELVPSYNYNRADTLASMKRIEGILAINKGRLIVQHDDKDIKSLPQIPNYLN